MTLAVILAAGRGARSGSDGPKSLQMLAEKTWQQWQRDALEAAGVGQSLLVTGYSADAFAMLPNQRHVYHAKWATSGPISSLWTALDAIPDQPLLIAYADCLWHPDWIARLIACEADIALSVDLDWNALWSRRFADPLSDAETLIMRGNGVHRWLHSIGAKPLNTHEIEGQFMGLWRVSAQGCSTLRNFLRHLIGDDLAQLDSTALFQRWLEFAPIACVVGAGAWLELDHRSDLDAYEHAMTTEDFSHDPRRPPRWPD